MSTAVYSSLDQNLAMSIGRKYKYRRIRPHDWLDFAKDINMTEAIVRKELKDLSKKVIEEAIKFKHELYEHYPSTIYDEIISVIKRRATFAFC